MRRTEILKLINKLETVQKNLGDVIESHSSQNESINHKFLLMIIYNTETYGLCVKFMLLKNIINSDELKTILSLQEINNLKKEYKTLKTAMPIEKYISLNLKSDYNYAEFAIITDTIYNNMILFLDTINTMFITIQNFYSRGKFKLDRNNPEEFINNVATLMTKYNFNLDNIRSQIKTVRLINIIVNNIITIIEKYNIPHLSDAHKNLIQSRKGILLNNIKEYGNQEAFENYDIQELKTKFKKDNKMIYEHIILIINELSRCNFSALFWYLYKQKNETNINMNKYNSLFKLNLEKLNKFVVSSDFNFDNIVNELRANINRIDTFKFISSEYYKHNGIYKFICSKETSELNKTDTDNID